MVNRNQKPYLYAPQKQKQKPKQSSRKRNVSKMLKMGKVRLKAECRNLEFQPAKIAGNSTFKAFSAAVAQPENVLSRTSSKQEYKNTE